MNDKRFIEESFPVKEVSEESAREKSIRHSYISTLHIWWARRPLASSRATNYAALIPTPENETDRERKKRFIIDLCKWKNSNNQHLMEKARKDILEANGGNPPKVLDPFSGGGAIPLEALRLGCETYAGEYNPVASLILRCTLEYPQKYGNPKEEQKSWNFLKESKKNPLIEDLKKWSSWIQNEVEKEIGGFYPKEPDGSIPIGYMWARTIRCQNPSCHAEIPLIRQFWLAKNKNRDIAIKPYVKDDIVKFNIVGQDDDFPKSFNPSNGSVKRAVAHCFVCGTTIDDKTTRKLFKEGKSGQRLIVVISNHPKKKGKTYRIADENDVKTFNESKDILKKKIALLSDKWGIDPLPDEPLPPKETLGFRVQRYGILKWGDLFNYRQKLAIITFIEKVRNAYEMMNNNGYDKEYTKAVSSYLALGVDRLVDFGSSLCVLNPTGGRGVVHTFGRQTIQMVWDYTESNPFNPFGAGWPTAYKKNEKWIEHASSISNKSIKIFQSAAQKIPYPNDFFDAVFTDPPYYDNVPYSYLSDFFYVWLKRSIGDLFPEYFATPLTPKTKEIVAYSHGQGGYEEGKTYFENNLNMSFKEIHRVLKPAGIATIVYNHKSTSGWETVINSLLDSGLVITASWPLHTEMRGRLRAQESAALASSIYFIARKLDRLEKGWYNEVKEEIKKHLYKKLERLWEEGISGADFLIAGIGLAIEIFGKYEKVLDYEGNVIRAEKFLNLVRDVVADYAVRQILHDGIAGELSPLTKFYILWRWNYKGAKVHFDDARKLAQSSGLDISREWNKGFVKKDKEFIRVLGPHERHFKDDKVPKELVDVLHYAVNLWKEGKRQNMNKMLQESGWGTKDALYRVAQAISSTLPQESREKKLLDGFLSGKKQILSEVTKVKQKQLDLFIKKGRE